MARRRTKEPGSEEFIEADEQREPHMWSLDPLDETSVPNARIALALLIAIRRLPAAYSEHDSHCTLGEVFAPVLEKHGRLTREAVEALVRARKGSETYGRHSAIETPITLHDRSVHSLLGEALVRSFPRFEPLFDKVQESLEAFLAKHSFKADRNVEMLARLIDLTAPEATLLRLATAFCYGSIDRSRFDFVDSQSRIINVVEKLCNVRGAATIRLLHGNGALTRSGLLEVESNKRSQCDLADLLRLSTIGECLLGTPFDDEQSMARAVLSPLQPPSAIQPLEWPHLRQEQALLKSALDAAIDTAAPGVNFLLYGGPGTGKTEFVRQLIAEIGAVGFVINDMDGSGAEASRSERLGSLQLSQTFAGQQARAVLVLEEAEDIFQNDYQHPMARLFGSTKESKSWVNALLEKNPHPVIWVSNRITQLDPAYLRRFSYCLEFPQTPLAVRRRIAQDRLGAVGCSDGLIESISAIPHVTPAHLESAARFAGMTVQAGVGTDTAVTSAIESQLKAGGHTLSPLKVKQATRFDMRYLNVRGEASPERVLQSLDRLGGDCGGATLLFSGPPGTGKTQFAGEIATRLGRQLVVRTASDINSKWYGESEANVARMFRESDPKTELLFLDEAEILLASREDSSQRADRAVTAEFLRWLEAFEGIFVCATNHAGTFDAALTRRFTFRLEFEPLRLDQRVELYAELALGWRPEARGCERPAPVDATERACLSRLEHLTPGDFANAARRIRALELPPSAWIAELEAEQDAKRGVGLSRIGFM